MRKFSYFLLLFFTVQLNASEPLKIGVITDVHYLSETLMDNGYTINSYVYETSKNVIATPEILDKVIDDYMNNNIDVLLVSGDLTKDGEKQSHLDFRQKLKPLHDKGVKIFVIPGNHDINMPNSMRYQGNKTFATDNINPKEFLEIYANYGYKQAIGKDTNSLSYVAELNSSTWLLTLDVARYDEYTNNPISSGKLKGSTELWMLDILQKAKVENKQVIAMMHWGVVEHIQFQGRFFPNYLVEDYKRVASLLADNGIRLVFTGHFHSNDITEFVSEKGNKIYDIETGALVSYPFAYRFVELTKNKIDIKTKNIIATASHPKLTNENKEILRRIATTRALPILDKLDFPFPQEQRTQLAEIVADIFLLHLYGDEKASAEMKNKLIKTFDKMGLSVDDGFENLEIDLPPADNNIILEIR